MYDILKKFGFDPRCYIYMREKDGFKNLYSIRLNVRQSNKLRLLLNRIIMEMGFQFSFHELKYELIY